MFAAGDVFAGGGASLVGVLYLIFLTDVVGLAPGLAGVAVLAAKLWDAVNDPLTGALSDRVRTRLGRRRPFILAGGLLLVPAMLLFWMPATPPDSQVGKAVWAAATYIVYNTVQTMIVVPYTSLSTEITDDFDTRNRLNVLRLVFSTVSSAAMTLLAARLFEEYRAGRLDASGLHLAIALGFGTLFALLVLAVGIVARERIRPSAASVPFSLRTFAEPLRFASYRRLLGMYLCQALTFDVISATVIYYTTYVALGVSSQVVLGVFIVVNLLAFPVISRLVNRTDKARIYRTLIPLAVVMIAAFALFPRGGNPVVLYLITFVLAVGFVGAQQMSWVMFPDVLDDVELTTGRRDAGSFAGLMSFLRNLSTALAIQLVGLVLQLTGYVAPASGQAVTQPESAQWGIRLVLLGAVAILLSIGWVIARHYPLTLARCRAMQDELATRRGAGQR